MITYQSGQNHFSSPNYDFTVKLGKNKTYILVVFKTKYFHTSQLPSTIPVLRKNLPSIFKCVCFNDQKKPFLEEAKDTELGHLLEHILLEYLCAAKINDGYSEAIYNGETKWNWNEDPRGTFHIYIDAGFKESYVFYQALRKTTWLLNKILETSSL